MNFTNWPRVFAAAFTINQRIFAAGFTIGEIFFAVDFTIGQGFFLQWTLLLANDGTLAFADSLHLFSFSRVVS